MLKHAAEAGKHIHHCLHTARTFSLFSFCLPKLVPPLVPPFPLPMKHPLCHFTQIIGSALHHPQILLPCCKFYITWAIIILKLHYIAGESCLHLGLDGPEEEWGQFCVGVVASHLIS